jgi:hypothetical protein
MGPTYQALEAILRNYTFWRRRRELSITRMCRSILAASFGGDATKWHVKNAS